MADFQYEPTVWNDARNLIDQTAKNGKTVRSAIQCRPRIEAANLRVKPGYIAGADVRWIAHQQFKLLGDVRKRIALHQLRAMLDTEAAGVVAGDRQGGFADVRADAECIGKLAEQCHQQAAGARADIQNAQGCRAPSLPVNPFECRLDQRLAFGPWIQRGRGDGKTAAVELPLAEDARDRLAIAAPGDAVIEPLRLLLTELSLRLADELGGRQAQHRSRQSARVVPGLVDAGPAQLRSRVCQGLAYGGHSRLSWLRHWRPLAWRPTRSLDAP